MIRTLRFCGILPLFVVLAVGCGKNSNAPASLSGTVKYKGAPVTGGTLTLSSKAGGNYSTSIGEDGTYSLAQLPAGEATVTIETESISPQHKMPEYTGGKRPAGVPSPRASTAPKLSTPPGAPTGPKGVYVKIPSKYSDNGKSGLSITLTAGKQTHVFELTD